MTAWAFYLVTVLPVSGIRQAGSIQTADRFAAVPTLGLFALLALVTGQTLFLTLNPIGILSRALVYGPSLALGWVLLLLLFAVGAWLLGKVQVPQTGLEPEARG